MLGAGVATTPVRRFIIFFAVIILRLGATVMGDASGVSPGDSTQRGRPGQEIRDERRRRLEGERRAKYLSFYFHKIVTSI